MLDSALAINPKHTGVYMQLAIMQAVVRARQHARIRHIPQQNDVSGALVLLKQAADIDPKLPTVRAALPCLEVICGRCMTSWRACTSSWASTRRRCRASSRCRAAHRPFDLSHTRGKAKKYARNIDELAAVCTTQHATEIQLDVLKELAPPNA